MRDYVAFIANNSSAYADELDSMSGFVSLGSKAPIDSKPSDSKQSGTVSEWGRLVTALYNSEMEIQVDGQVHRLTENGTAGDDDALSAIFAGISGHEVGTIRGQSSTVAHQARNKSITVRESSSESCFRGPFDFGLGTFRIEGRVELINEDDWTGVEVSVQVEGYDSANDEWFEFDAVTRVEYSGTASLTTYYIGDDGERVIVDSYGGDFENSATDGSARLVDRVGDHIGDGEPLLTTTGTISGSFGAEVEIGGGYWQVVLGSETFGWNCEIDFSG